MDTTPKYILMCEKAEEIRKGKSPEWLIEGDYYCEVSEYPFDNELLIKLMWRHKGLGRAKKRIWLPRQDQLQEIVAECFADLRSAINNFGLWCCHKYSIYQTGQYEDSFHTGEQLWLAFVMHEKYQKQWHEEKEGWEGE